MRSRYYTYGTTLVELIITIMVVSVALTGVLMVINFNARTSADPMIHHQTAAIAEAYLEEILTKEFTDPDGTNAGETRATYDNVADYHNLANNGCLTTTAACPTLGSCACNQNGDPIDGLQGYVVSVQITSEALGSIGAANVWRVQVRVTPPRGDAIVISSYRTNY